MAFQQVEAVLQKRALEDGERQAAVSDNKEREKRCIFTKWSATADGKVASITSVFAQELPGTGSQRLFMRNERENPLLNRHNLIT